jgi:hypothetical protein
VRIAQIADLDHWMNPSGRVDEFAFADIHAGVRDVIGRAAEEKQVAGLQLVPLHRHNAVRRALQIGIARHRRSAPAAEHLRETGTVVAEAGRPAPGVRQPKEAAAQLDCRFDRERLRVESHVAALQPACTIVGQADFEPALIILWLGDHFQARLERHREKRPSLGDIGLAIDMREQAVDLRYTSGGCIRFLACALAQGIRRRHPTRVLVGCADMQPAGPLFDDAYGSRIDRLRDYFGVFIGLRVHVRNRLHHDSLRGGRG